MLSFDALINNLTFSCLRVPYGMGDLWYHVSITKDEVRVIFRMSNKNHQSWKMYDTKDSSILAFEKELGDEVAKFERSLITATGEVKVISATSAKQPK